MNKAIIKNKIKKIYNNSNIYNKTINKCIIKNNNQAYVQKMMNFYIKINCAYKKQIKFKKI